MKISLQRPPCSSNSTRWENIDVTLSEVLQHCKDYASFHNLHSQVVVLDVTDGPLDAPMIGVYWCNDQRLQWF